MVYIECIELCTLSRLNTFYTFHEQIYEMQIFDLDEKDWCEK